MGVRPGCATGSRPQAAVGMAHITPSGDFLRVNRRLCEILGYSESELKRLNLNDLNAQHDVTDELNLLDSLRRNESGSFTLQKSFTTKQGQTVWGLQTVSCVRDDEGKIKYLVAVIDDISALKQMEAQLQAERKQTALILDVSGDGILGLDIRSRHTFVNPAAAKMLGYKVDEMLGKESHAMWHHTYPDGQAFPETECPITAVLREGNVHRGHDAVFWRKDGKPLLVEFISTPILEDGEVTGAVVVFRSDEREEG